MIGRNSILAPLAVIVLILTALFAAVYFKYKADNETSLKNVPIANIQIASELSDPSRMPRNGTGPFFGFEINLVNEVHVGLYKTKHFRVRGADYGGIGQIFAATSNPQNKYAFDYLHLQTNDEGKTFYLTGEIKLHQVK